MIGLLYSRIAGSPFVPWLRLKTSKFDLSNLYFVLMYFVIDSDLYFFFVILISL